MHVQSFMSRIMQVMLQNHLARSGNVFEASKIEEKNACRSLFLQTPISPPLETHGSVIAPTGCSAKNAPKNDKTDWSAAHDLRLSRANLVFFEKNYAFSASAFIRSMAPSYPSRTLYSLAQQALAKSRPMCRLSNAHSSERLLICPSTSSCGHVSPSSIRIASPENALVVTYSTGPLYESKTER